MKQYKSSKPSQNLSKIFLLTQRMISFVKNRLLQLQLLNNLKKLANIYAKD